MSFFEQVVKVMGRLGSNQVDVDSRGSKNALAVEVLDGNGNQITGFGTIPFAYDTREITWTNGNATQIVYRSGGASGAIVATETLTYDGDDNPTLIVRA